MKRIIILACMLMLLIIGCSEDDEEIIEETLDVSYLPVVVGNWWEYAEADYPEDTVILSVTGTTNLKDGKNVFIIESERDRGYLSRAVNDMVLFHETLDDLSGELIYRSILSVGTTWQNSLASVKVASRDIVSTPSGIFEDCYRVDVKVVDEHDYYSIWLAKNVGPVKIAEIDPDDQEIEESIVLSDYGVAGSDSDKLFPVDSSSADYPKVKSISVKSGAEIGNSESIYVSFSKPMESVSITVTGASGSVISSGNSAVWIPDNKIPSGEHTLIIDGYDTENQSLLEPTFIKFRVVPDDDIFKGNPPLVTSVSIAEGSQVAGNQAITVTFSKAVTSATIIVTGATGTTTVAGKTATWTPTGEIPPGAHTMTVSAEDSAGQALEGAVPINFTAVAPNNTPPALDGGACDPKDGGTGVDPADYPEKLTLVFTEALTDATVTAKDPDFKSTEELAGNTLTITFLQYSMPNETEFVITIFATDAAGNTAEIEYGFTTMAKEG
ncbi:hypothetical protein GF312_01090 [Candidatus Poribacteria bacterium]|nr:hypothetical protein [Candidatus Poribacteria bacterium]